MDFTTQYIAEGIKLATFAGKNFTTEVVLEHHILVWFISGETRIIQADASYTFSAGDVFLLPRNQITTVINYPKDGLPHKTVAMHLTKQVLQQFYTSHKAVGRLQPLQKVYSFKNHPLLQSCLASLIPYFELGEKLPEELANIKTTEAITILHTIDKTVDSMLANFDEPGKINLGDFMERHYMFNLPLQRFSYLTGRSLATFRRDFEKTYGCKPQQWLTEKRLILAHHEIVHKHRRPSDVYIEAGFENLSHFSFAFKQRFGQSPGNIKKGEGL